MAQLVGVITESGQGKSRSIIGLPPEHTLVVSTVGKMLPFPGSRGKYKPLSGDISTGNFYVPQMGSPDIGTYTGAGRAKSASDILSKILKAIPSRRPDIKYIVIDDYQYFMSLEYMQEARKSGWDKFSEIAIHSWQLLEIARNLPEEMVVFFLTHPEEVGKGEKSKVVMKTIGKMLREKITPEGYFPIVFIGDPLINDETGAMEYRFRTQTNGADVAKSPEGMFPLYIENDLGKVAARINEYFEDGLALDKSTLFENGVSQKSSDGITL